MARVLKPGPNKPKPVQPGKPRIPRLPPGSRFEAVYSHTPSPKWSGALYVLGQGFTVTSGGVYGAMNKLDREYRRWLGRQSAEVKARHTEHLK